MDKKTAIDWILSDFPENNLCFDNKLSHCFFAIYRYLEKKFGCVYFSYILECKNTGNKILLATNQEWGSLFYQNGLIKNCHLAATCRNIKNVSQNFTLVWNDIRPDNNEARKVHSLRHDFRFDNGISYANKLSHFCFGQYYELINIIGDTLDLNFYREIEQHKTELLFLLKKLRVKGYVTLTNKNISSVILPPANNNQTNTLYTKLSSK
jgi:hypothetical protein